MHRMFRNFFLFPCLAFFAFVSPSLASAPDHLHALRTAIKSDFFLPLVSVHHLDTSAARGAVLLDHTPRPTQGGNVMTATDISMTRSFDGILGNRHGARDAIIGSSGIVN